MATIFEYGLHREVDRELDENGNVLVEYTREPDGALISEHRNGVDRFYHFDGHGNTLSLTDINGDVTDTFAYNASGEVTARTGATDTPFQFHGEQGLYFDSETGDYLSNDRPMDASAGRWMAPKHSDFAHFFNSYSISVPESLIDAIRQMFFAQPDTMADNGGDNLPDRPRDEPLPNACAVAACGPDEKPFGLLNVAMVEAVVDSELDTNYIGVEFDKNKNPIRIKRKDPPTDTGKSTVHVILQYQYYKLTCCVDKNRNVRLLDLTKRESRNLSDNFIVLPTPPKPPTKRNMKKLIDYVYPVRFWRYSAGIGSDIYKCLKKAEDIPLGPNKSIPRRDFDT